MDPIRVENDHLVLYPAFLDNKTADQLYKSLLSHLAWSQESIKMFGKSVLVPRLVCWYGDQDAIYKYSGVQHNPLPWTPSLLNIKSQLESFTQHQFNSVLGNLYRNEKDSMGWHSDNEKELGLEPFIASLSLGEERIFKAKHKTARKQVKLPLPHGSLLVMSGNFQQLWQHCIPKCSAPRRERINLTFRHIISTG